ncbi:MAG: FtsW/RodA/SpoVE family cell cycle protein [Paludibacteraceae bacterium]|nr:FtsW/RodA/SpoVE family cell cycle protein [Paludibacteraceae bacterium]
MKEFLAKHFKGDAIIWVVFVVLIVVSTLEMFSASSMLVYDRRFHGTAFKPILSHMVFLGGGFALAYVIHLVQPKKIFFWGGAVGYVLSILMLVGALAFGTSANGASRWIHVPGLGVNLQPSEFAKISVVLLLSSLLGYFHRKKSVDDGLKFYLLVLIPPAILIMVENLSTFILLVTVSALLFFIGGISLKKMLPVVGSIVGVGLVVVLLTFAESWIAPEKSGLKVEGVEQTSERTCVSFVTHRVGTWINRFKRHSGADLSPEERKNAKFDVTSDDKVQTGHSHIAIANGKWFGRGIGNSIERDFIPQSFSDFIFAVIVEECGVMSILLVILYLALFYRACVIMNKSESFSNSFAVIGLSAMIVLQAFIHMSVVLGLIPVTGQPLPIISRGGTSILTTSCYFGIILALSRTVTEEKPVIEKSKSSSSKKAQPEEKEPKAADPGVVAELSV